MTARTDTQRVYYHGGMPGLRLGELLLPPSETGRTDTASRIAREELGATYVRSDRVFLGSTVDMAALYAAMYPAVAGGWMYECEPTGLVEPDPDYHGDDPMESVQCESATITRVLGPVPPATVNGIRRALMGGAA